jgi:hypothetical protein
MERSFLYRTAGEHADPTEIPAILKLGTGLPRNRANEETCERIVKVLNEEIGL